MEIVTAILSALAAAAPGLLPLITGKASEEEAREYALSAVTMLHAVRVDEIINARRREIEEADRVALGSILHDAQLTAHLTPQQRSALRRVSVIALPGDP